jgi:hypothetical protein
VLSQAVGGRYDVRSDSCERIVSPSRDNYPLSFIGTKASTKASTCGPL